MTNLVDNVNFELEILSKDWKEALETYKTGDHSAFPKLNPKDDPWDKYYYLIMGLVVEAAIINNQEIQTLLRNYIQDVYKIKVSKMQYFSIALLFIHQRNTKDGCVPDLIIQVTLEDGRQLLLVIEIKSIPFKFNQNTRKSKAKAGLALKQVTKCKKIIEDIFISKNLDKPIIKTCLLIAEGQPDGTHNVHYSFR